MTGTSAPARRPLPWARILTEGFVIVASILLAFAIDAWWEERQDDRRGREYAAGILEDANENLSRLEAARSGTGQIVAAAAELSERITQPIPTEDEDTVLLLLTIAFDMDPFVPVTQGFDQVVAAGELGLLPPDLRDALSAWDAAVEENADLEAQIEQDRHVSYAPFMIEETSLRRAFSLYEPEAPLGESAFPPDVSHLVRNRRLDNLLTYRTLNGHLRLRGMEVMRQTLDSLIATLERAAGGGT